MAGEKISYPMLPAKNWWALRKKFQGSLPTAVTPGYIAPVLGMNEKSASNNVLPYLRTMGLIDDKGKPTERSNAWRIDEKYPEVCNEIKSEIYDQELLDAFPGQIENRVSVEQWFLSKTGVGKVAANRMASQFELLAEADPTKSGMVSKKKPLATKPTATKKRTVRGR